MCQQHTDHISQTQPRQLEKWAQQQLQEEEDYLSRKPLEADHSQQKWRHEDPNLMYRSSQNGLSSSGVQYSLQTRQQRQPKDPETFLSNLRPGIGGIKTSTGAPKSRWPVKWWNPLYYKARAVEAGEIQYNGLVIFNSTKVGRRTTRRNTGKLTSLRILMKPCRQTTRPTTSQLRQ